MNENFLKKITHNLIALVTLSAIVFLAYYYFSPNKTQALTTDNAQANQKQTEMPANNAEKNVHTETPKTENIISTSTEEKIDDKKVKKNKIIKYTVKSGDTLSVIAEKFNINTNTILQANNLKYSSLIKPGDELTILPIDGIIYFIKSGDTISKISYLYDVDSQKILETNNLSSDSPIKIGQKIIIPGDKLKTNSSPVKTISKATKNVSSNSKTYSGVTWTSGALHELYKIPTFVRPTVKSKINSYAISHHIYTITTEIYKKIKI